MRRYIALQNAIKAGIHGFDGTEQREGLEEGEVGMDPTYVCVYQYECIVLRRQLLLIIRDQVNARQAMNSLVLEDCIVLGDTSCFDLEQQRHHPIRALRHICPLEGLEAWNLHSAGTPR